MEDNSIMEDNSNLIEKKENNAVLLTPHDKKERQWFIVKGIGVILFFALIIFSIGLMIVFI